MAWSRMLHRAGPRELTLVIICFTIIQLSSSKQCHTGFDTAGVTYPAGDIFIEYGNPLEIFCILDDEYVKKYGPDSSKNITFEQDGKPIPEEMIEIVNSSTIRFYMEKPPLSNTMYFCKFKEGDALCLNMVSVGTKPQEVTDFSCIGHNYVNMVCTWTGPKNYVMTNYSLTYHYQGRNSRVVFKCPKIQTSMNNTQIKYKCFWDLSTEPHYRQSQPMIFFNLSASNIFGRGESLKYNFSHFANVLPEPPENLTLVNKTSDSVCIYWAMPRPMHNFPPGLVQRVKYQSEFDNKSEWKVANTSRLHDKFFHTYILSGLKYAHALYDIRVSIRSARASVTDESMWSKFASLTVRTMSKIPDEPPRVNIGSFEAISSLTVRDIYVYWSYIPEHMRNGENFTYKIIEVEENGIKRALVPNETTNAYARFKGLSLESYRFTIVSANEVGYSERKSVVYVPGYRDRVPEPESFTKIAFKDGIYELSWMPPKVGKGEAAIKNYTIFWCQNERDRPYPCKGLLKWIEVGNNISIYNITVPEDPIYQFAIAANTEYASSGMVWASCTVIHYDRGIGKMKSLWIDDIGSTFIEVGWKLDCSDRIGSIEGFKIFYCPIISPIEQVCKENEQQVNITGDPLITRGNVTGLRPYTTYMLTVSVITRYNSNILQSDRLFNTTLEAVPDTPPLNVRVDAITTNSVEVMWAPPTAMNGVLRYYEVLVKSKEETFTKRCEVPHNKKVSDETDHSQQMVILNLKSYTKYNISVAACTVGCSEYSAPITINTAITTPNQMREPNIRVQNETTISISWSRPSIPGGPISYYELRIKEKTLSKNTTRIIKTSRTEYEIQNCEESEISKVYYFSVRAVNIDNGHEYEGQWSPELENYCRSAPTIYLWIILLIFIVALVVVYIILRKVWERCQLMRRVEVKLPPGLASSIVPDEHWPVPSLQNKQNDDSLIHMRTLSSADAEHLLPKKLDNVENHDTISGGDSSGCSSGQESVTSSIASGTNLSGTSDSGTEQPRTPSSGNVSRENSLRQRKPGSEILGWEKEITWPNSKSYVPVMPNMEKPNVPSASWPNKPIQPGNYCVLGVDTSTSDSDTGRAYVPVPVSVPHSEQAKGSDLKSSSPAYVTCDSVFNKPSDVPLSQTTPVSSYVKSEDLGKITGSKFKNLEQSETPPSYVVVGDNKFSKPHLSPSALSTGELIKLDPGNTLPAAYMQKAADDVSKALPVYTKTGEVHLLKYKSECPESTSSGYVKTDDILELKNTGIADLKAEPLDVQTSDYPLSSYCRLGWDSKKPSVVSSSLDSSGVSVGVCSANLGPGDSLMVQSKTGKAGAESTKGYVPHRHFESKVLKED